MKMNLDTSNLDWNNATIRDYRYIHHLVLMIHERWTKLGLASSGLSLNTTASLKSSGTSTLPNTFKICRFTPGGLLSWDQLSSIYHAMVYLGLYVYFNPDNFKEENYVRGDMRKLPVFDLKDMCRIADFDFFAHPFIPGQPLDYYSQFLNPIRKVLASYKYISSNVYHLNNDAKTARTIGSSQICTVGKRSSIENDILENPKKNDNDVYQGRDKIDFLADGSNHIKACKEWYECYKNQESFFDTYENRGTVNDSIILQNSAILGYDYSVTTFYLPWTNYGNQVNADDQVYYSVDEGLVINSFSVEFGNLFKLVSAYPPGIPYTVYLCHTTYKLFHPESWQVPRYYNSPWDNILTIKTGTVPENGEVMEWIELPSWDDIPTDYPNSTKGEKFIVKLEDNEPTTLAPKETENRSSYPLKAEDHYAAFYYPLFVFNFESKFQYS